MKVKSRSAPTSPSGQWTSFGAPPSLGFIARQWASQSFVPSGWILLLWFVVLLPEGVPLIGQYLLPQWPVRLGARLVKNVLFGKAGLGPGMNPWVNSRLINELLYYLL